MNTPECPNPRCFGYPGIWQRTDFADGRITEVYRCARCKRQYQVVATTLVMLPGDDQPTERMTPLVESEDA